MNGLNSDTKYEANVAYFTKKRIDARQNFANFR